MNVWMKASVLPLVALMAACSGKGGDGDAGPQEPVLTCASETVEWTVAGKTCSGTTPVTTADGQLVSVAASISINTGVGRFVCDAAAGRGFVFQGDGSSCNEPSEPPQAARLNPASGFYEGSVTETRVVSDGQGGTVELQNVIAMQGAIAPSMNSANNASLGIFYSKQLGEVFASPVAVNEGKFSGALRRYLAVDLTSFSIQGLFGQLANFRGDVTSNFTIEAVNQINTTDKDELFLVYDTGISSRIASVENLAATYTGRDDSWQTPRTMTLMIGGDGAITGSNSEGCAFSGAIRLPSNQLNVFEVDSFSVICPALTTGQITRSAINFSGNGIAVPLTATRLYIGVRDADNAFVYELDRPAPVATE